MDVKNLSELKKALKTNQPSIKVKDEKFKAKIIKSAMKKGRLYSYDGQQITNIEDLNPKKAFGGTGVGGGVGMIVISGSVLAAIGFGLFALFSIFALYRKYNIKIIYNKDKTLTITFETNK